MSTLDEGFFKRFSSSLDRVLLGLDSIVAAIFTFLLCFFAGDSVTKDVAVRLFDSATPLVITLIIVIVTSVSILVSLSNSDAISQLKKRAVYKKFLFTFELTAVLALVAALISIVAQTANAQEALFYPFVFILSYTVLAVFTVISRLITYGDKVAQISLAKDLPDDLSSRVNEVHPGDENEKTEFEGDSETETEESS